MAVVGYARVSSTGQSLDVQVEQLRAAGCTKIFQEKWSGTSGRAELQRALDYIREGDVFVVCRLDRLARSIVDLRKIIDTLTGKEVGFRVLQQAIDTTRAEGRLMLHLLGAFAEFETDLRKERQTEGGTKAKLAGRYKGRPKSIAPATIAALKAEGMGASLSPRNSGLAGLIELAL
ncbi:DNA invertase Pin-like site-specific DNA recombinase [Rhizomicrobium palustre]|uniref:DNA invertase Pin-like site-specific DNA recombinase n=1 Tax=Rhizomicrobium palustre TaxID=189966 RepID=A0A846MZB7_9PROT|nr:recombinase family protein [Rhizomicrobium palustre]NIK88786.1 DNA invertase Pin-like site-specific DNA recombinase [Rhizomicrobium palustre]